jgi:hypothetical protein
MKEAVTISEMLVNLYQSTLRNISQDGHLQWHQLLPLLCHTIAQHWEEKTLLETCATMTLDRISATMMYLMWREEHLWNASALQRVHLSNVVSQETRLWKLLDWTIVSISPNESALTSRHFLSFWSRGKRGTLQHGLTAVAPFASRFCELVSNLQQLHHVIVLPLFEWIRAGRPGDRGSIPGRGKGFFL